jgi:hypothetical protein
MAFLAVLALLVVFMFFALAVDTGVWFFDHRTAQNQVDAAALAALQELPARPGDTGAATAAASEWLARNGYSGGSDCSPPTDGTPYVIDDGIVYLDSNDDGLIDSLRICVRRKSPGIFSTMFGVPFAYVSAAATATLHLPPPVEIAMAMDDTGTMLVGCNSGQTNTDCPIKQARDAANIFVDMLLRDDGVYQGIRIAMAPFRGCYGDQRYDPISGEAPGVGCVLFSEMVGLTLDQAALQARSDGLRAEGGYPGTNVCLGLYQSYQDLLASGTTPTPDRVVVILTDGDNRYSDGAEYNLRGNNPNPLGTNAPPLYPPPQWPNSDGTPTHPCRVTEPAQDGTRRGPDYDARINNLDVRTDDLATTMKNNGVEIYVVGYGVVGGSDDGSLCNPVQVGTGSSRHDGNDKRDRNLAKCIASSTPGTNDHYFEAPDPEAIPGIFEAIAVDILGQAALTK